MAPFRRLAAAGIATAIALVQLNHWRLVIRHVHLQKSDHRVHRVGAVRNIRRNENVAPDTTRGNASSDVVDPYLLSPICGGCFRSRNTWKVRSRTNYRECADLVLERQRRNNSTLLEAATQVGKRNRDCNICNPDNCLRHYFKGTNQPPPASGGAAHNTKYWRFDRCGPNFTNPTTLSLDSIPSELRIPPSRFGDAGAFFEEKFRSSSSPKTDMGFLVEYNPGIVALPAMIKRNLPKEAAYLVSLRVTPANNCFASSINVSEAVHHAMYHNTMNHLGLALLDERYRTIPGYEAIINLSEQLRLRRNPEVYNGANFVDYRLFVLNNEIYLHANADTVVVTKLLLRGEEFGNVDDLSEQNDANRMDYPYHLENVYGGDKLQVTLVHQFNTIWSGGKNGKNYALFGVPNATHPDAPDSIYAEISITPKHQVQHIKPDEYDQLSKQDIFGIIWKPGTHKNRRLDIDLINMRKVVEGNATESEDAPMPNFSTVDEYWFPGGDAPFKDDAHGGACCVHFSLDDLGGKSNHHDPLLVGIAHTKVAWRRNFPADKKERLPYNHYVSFFYAFDIHPPFQLRARSGYFCLGHVPLAKGDAFPLTEGGNFNPRHILTRNRELQQNFQRFDCPQIHFISSFIEKAGDGSTTVIGYGLNDCTGRLVEVEKNEIVRLLYPDPMDMVFERA